MTTTSTSTQDADAASTEDTPVRRRGVRALAAGLGGAFAHGVVYRIGVWLAEQILS